MKNIAIEKYTCLNIISPEYIRDLVKYKFSNYNFRYENMEEVGESGASCNIFS